MLIKDSSIFAAIEIIGVHYRSNISNRFTQRVFDTMSFDPAELRRAQDLFEKSENYRYQGFHLDELYAQILAAGHFVSCARSQVLPTLRIESLQHTGQPNEHDRVLRDMAVNSFGLNLNILADMLGDLYAKSVEVDKESRGAKEPVYMKLPDLSNLGRYLSSCN